MKKILVTGSVLASLLLSGVALAAANPAVTGQPGANCELSTMAPNGFSTDGFAHAKTVYAGSDGSASLAHSNSSKAVSQYDVACFQLSNK